MRTAQPGDCEILVSLSEHGVIHSIRCRVHADNLACGRVINDLPGIVCEGERLELDTREREEAMGLLGIREQGWCDVEEAFPRERPI